MLKFVDNSHPLDILFETVSIFVQFRFSSIVTPRNLVLFTRFNVVLPKIIDALSFIKST